MLAQLFGAFARLEPVRIARTDEERAAVFRMRYSVYINEKNAGYIEGRDDVRRELRFPEDDEPESTLFYVGTPQAMRGTLRVTTWAPGKIPADFVRRYSPGSVP